MLSSSLLVVTSEQLLSSCSLETDGNHIGGQFVQTASKIQEIGSLNLDTVVNEHVGLRRLSVQYGRYGTWMRTGRDNFLHRLRMRTEKMGMKWEAISALLTLQI